MGPQVWTRLQGSGKSLRWLPVRPGIQGHQEFVVRHHLQLMTALCTETQHSVWIFPREVLMSVEIVFIGLFVCLLVFYNATED